MDKELEKLYLKYGIVTVITWISLIALLLVAIIYYFLQPNDPKTKKTKDQVLVTIPVPTTTPTPTTTTTPTTTASPISESIQAADVLPPMTQQQPMDTIIEPPKVSMDTVSPSLTLQTAQPTENILQTAVSSAVSSVVSTTSTTQPTTQSQPQPVSSSEIELYETCGYGGWHEKFKTGDYRYMPEVGVSVDSVSSVKVPKGCTLKLYESPGFTGKELSLTEDVHCLTSKDFDNKSASFKVNCN